MTWALLPYVEQYNAVLEISHGSPRTLAVLGGALLDASVTRTLRERFIEDEAIADNVLNIDRALGNLGPKIDVLYLLGAFDKTTRGSLKSLSYVRNFFAHNPGASFDSLDSYYIKAMSRLTLHEGRTHYPHHLYGPDSTRKIEEIKTKRDQFTVNLKLALIFLMRDRISHEPYTNTKLSDDEIHKRQHKLREAQDRQMP